MKIHVITQAYNAEATIGRAIESVLAQTHSDFRYYVLDSASTDGTMDRINEYAKRDSRIVPLHNDFNRLTAYMEYIPFMIAEANEGDAFAMLDADDAYHPAAFEKLSEFMGKHHLDMAVGGVSILSSETGMKTGSILVEDETIYQREQYAWHFPAYYIRVRTVWGKLITFNVLKKCDFNKAKSFLYGADTAFILEVIKNTNLFGLMPEPTYSYYQSNLSVSHRFEEARMRDGKNLYEIAYSFLSAFGDVTQCNLDFLLMVYFNMIQESIHLMNSSACGISAKLALIKKLFDESLTKNAFALDIISDDEKYALIKMMLEGLDGR